MRPTRKNGGCLYYSVSLSTATLDNLSASSLSMASLLRASFSLTALLRSGELPRDDGRDDEREPGREEDLEPGREEDLEPGREEDLDPGRDRPGCILDTTGVVEKLWISMVSPT
mmetsp:Transcript_46341/g.100543  ORF Transcript_46341/g.100543 Transcript_46341/m.100543 type:complete len:114 (+) Transcript_46341:26-367(+)